jgi:ATP-dependent Lon protease
LPGYTEDEKTNIAQNYLVPKQIKNNGLKDEELVISEAAIRDIIRYYTREAGVRNLEREISKICRKVVKTHLMQDSDRRTLVMPKNLDKYLGVRRFRYGMAEQHDQVGQVTGLAWTEVGGELLTIEAAVVAWQGQVPSDRQAR